MARVKLWSNGRLQPATLPDALIAN
jgi:hypothetical protein